MRDPLDDLSRLTDMIYQADLAKLQKLNAEEAKLRENLKALQTRAHTAADRQMVPMRQIGADVLWQGWVSRTRQELNIKLAQVLMRKEQMKTDLKRSFGKHQAVEELHRDQVQNRIKAREKRREQMQETLRLARPDRGPGNG